MIYTPPYGHSKNKTKIEVELDLPKYVAKSDLDNATGVDTLQFAKKDDLGNLKSEADKLDINKLEKVLSGLSSLNSKINEVDVDKLVPVPNHLSKESNLVKMKLLKRLYIMNWSKMLLLLIQVNLILFLTIKNL